MSDGIQSILATGLTNSTKDNTTSQNTFDREEYIKKTPLFQIDPNIAGASAYQQ